MEISTITLDPQIQDIQVEVFFGEAQLGTYKLALRDSQGKNPILIGKGNNIDFFADKHNILSPPEDLINEKMLSWSLIIGSLQPGPNQRYFATVTVTQNGKKVPGGTFPYQGEFQNSENILGIAKFV